MYLNTKALILINMSNHTTQSRFIAFALSLILMSAATRDTSTPMASEISGDSKLFISFIESTDHTNDVSDLLSSNGSAISENRPAAILSAVGLRAVKTEPLLPGDTNLGVLVDTSASQAGEHHRHSTELVKELVKKLPAQSRILLASVDVSLDTTMAGFKNPLDTSTANELEKISTKTPLGTTDFVNGILEAAKRYSEDTANNQLLYIGDGPGLNGITPEEFKRAVSSLIDKKIIFHAVAIGPRVNWQFLAAVANATGGTVSRYADTTTTAFATTICEALQTPVVWTRKATVHQISQPHVTTDNSIADYSTFELNISPIRQDRDTVIFLSTLDPTPTLSIVLDDTEGSLESPIKLTLEIPPASSDNSYLSELFSRAISTDGSFLPAIGKAGLQQMKEEIRSEAVELARLSQQAATNNDLPTAYRLGVASHSRRASASVDW